MTITLETDDYKVCIQDGHWTFRVARFSPLVGKWWRAEESGTSEDLDVLLGLMRSQMDATETELRIARIALGGAQ